MTNVAERIHSWSVRERQLVGTIESLGVAPPSLLAPTPSDDRSTAHSELTVLPSQIAASGGGEPLTDSVHYLADWIRSLSNRDRQLASAIAGLGAETAAQPESRPAESHTNGNMPTGPSPPFDGSDEFNFGAPPQDPDARDAPALGAPPQPDSLDNFLSSISTSRPNSPFDDLITAIAKRPILGKDAGTLPPATRFRVRVAEVGKPHRATKRNYDYFEDLNAVIAASAERSDIPYLA